MSLNPLIITKDIPGQDEIGYPVGKNLKGNMSFIETLARNLGEGLKIKSRTLNWEHTNLVCTGSSGAIISALVFDRLKLSGEVIYIEKVGEMTHHSMYDIKPRVNSFNVFVDDFICSCRTFNRVAEKFAGPIHGIAIGGKIDEQWIKDKDQYHENIELVICSHYTKLSSYLNETKHEIASYKPNFEISPTKSKY